MEMTTQTERVLAGVKDPVTSAEFIRFVCASAQLTGAHSVYLLHVVENLEDIRTEVAPGETPFEALMRQFQAQAGRVASEFPGLKIQCDIREGNKDEVLLHWIQVQNAQLLILGRRAGKLGSSSRSIRIARLAPCQVLLVPESHSWKPVRRVLLPVDFSDYSELGIRAAARIPGLKELVCLNVYEVPSGFYYSGLTESEAEARMVKNAKDAWDKFKRVLPESTPFEIIPAFYKKQESRAEDIRAYSRSADFQLMVIGSKGLTGATGFILGSVTQDLIRELDSMPVLITKMKEERISLIDALIG